MALTIAMDGTLGLEPIGEAPIPEAYSENGRLYMTFHKGQYLFPCDRGETSRLDMFHHLFGLVRRRLHTAPVPQLSRNQPARVLDLGCGSGFWVADMANNYPHAQVLGVDMVRIHRTIDPQYEGRINYLIPVDIEQPWPYALRQEPWDFIHLGMLRGGIADWPLLYSRIWENLRPDGWVEQVEFDWTPRSDDGSVTPRHVVSQAVNALYTAMDLAARDMRINSSEIRKQYENAGFTDIREEVYRIPFNMWDSSLTEVGHWMNAAFYAAFEGQLMAPLTRLLQIPKDQTLRMAAQAVGEVQTKRNHGYFLLQS